MRNLVAITLLFLVLACVQNENLPQKSKEQIINDFFLKKTGIDLSRKDEKSVSWLELPKPLIIRELNIEYYFPSTSTGIKCFYIFDNKTNNNYFKCNGNEDLWRVNELRKNEIIEYANVTDSIGFFWEKSYPEEAIEEYLNEAFLDSLVSYKVFKLLLDKYYQEVSYGRIRYCDINDGDNFEDLVGFLKKEMTKLDSNNKINKNKKDKLLRDVNYLLLPPSSPHEEYKLIYCFPNEERFRVVKLFVHALKETYDHSIVITNKFYYSMIIKDISLYADY